MTISKDAIGAAAHAYSNVKHPSGHLYAMERALTAALPFLALRPAPSQSDEERARELWGLPKDGATLLGEKKVKEFATALATVRAESTLAGAAKDRKIAEMDALLTDAYHGEAKAKGEIAALREAMKAARDAILRNKMPDIEICDIIDAALTPQQPPPAT